MAAGSVCAFAAGAGFPGPAGAPSEGGTLAVAGAGFSPAGFAVLVAGVVGVAGFAAAGFCADAGVDGVAG